MFHDFCKLYYFQKALTYIPIGFALVGGDFHVPNIWFSRFPLFADFMNKLTALFDSQKPPCRVSSSQTHLYDSPSIFQTRICPQEIQIQKSKRIRPTCSKKSNGAGAGLGIESWAGGNSFSWNRKSIFNLSSFFEWKWHSSNWDNFHLFKFLKFPSTTFSINVFLKTLIPYSIQKVTTCFSEILIPYSRFPRIPISCFLEDIDPTFKVSQNTFDGSSGLSGPRLLHFSKCSMSKLLRSPNMFVQDSGCLCYLCS